MMLRLSDEQLDELYQHGEVTWPAECCGILIGRRDGDDRQVERVWPCTNLRAGEANDVYEIGAADRKAAEDAAAAAGQAVVGFYHSHPDHDAYFSPTDLAHSEEFAWGEPWLPPTYAYLVISIHGGRRDHYKAFLVADGAAVAEPVALTTSSCPT